MFVVRTLVRRLSGLNSERSNQFYDSGSSGHEFMNRFENYPKMG
jgi:hypothetical protein